MDPGFQRDLQGGCYQFQQCTRLLVRRTEGLFVWEQGLLATAEFPDIFYLSIDRPARLRPDAVRHVPLSTFLALILYLSMPPVIAYISCRVLAFSKAGRTTSGTSSLGRLRDGYGREGCVDNPCRVTGIIVVIETCGCGRLGHLNSFGSPAVLVNISVVVPVFIYNFHLVLYI